MLDAKAHTRTCLIDLEAALQVEDVLRTLIPRYYPPVLLMEEDEGRVATVDVRNKGAIYDCIRAEVHSSRKVTDAILSQLELVARYVRKGASIYLEAGDGKSSVFLACDEYELAPHVDGSLHWGNSLHLSPRLPVLTEGMIAETIDTFCDILFGGHLFEYGYVCHPAEFEALNIDRSRGVEAVGLDVGRALPGLYWGNFFGSHLVGHIGEDKLFTTPGYMCRKLESGLFVQSTRAPWQWSEDAYIATRAKAISHLGTQLFFEKGKNLTGRLFTFTPRQPA